MSSTLQEQSCAVFAEKLASNAPTPGGGGAAALSGALAAALGAMAARLSAKGQEERFASVLERLDAQRLALLRQIDADAEGFAPLAAAYRLPKDAPERAEALRRATLDACQAPAEMLRVCAETASELLALLPLCKKLMLSDLGCAALLCAASAQCARMNVLVNTAALRPEAQALALEAETAALLAQVEEKTQAVAACVWESLL